MVATEQPAAVAPLLAANNSDENQNNFTLQGDRIGSSSGSKFIWSLTLSAGISGLLFGYDTGVISSTLVSVGTDLSNRPLTVLDKSLVTSCTSLFALIASPLAGILADRFGRKSVILVADSLFGLGALWQALTVTVEGMTIGRSIVGLGVGAASLVSPLYVSELAPSYLRGRLVTILSLFITGGQVIAYLVGWLLSTTPQGWRWMVGLGAVPAFVQLFILITLPETPRWLVQAGSKVQAKRALERVYGPNNAEAVEYVFRAITNEIAEEGEECSRQKPGGTSQFYHHTLATLSDLFRIGGNRRALMIATMLQGLQQLCGFNSLMYFSATIFASLQFSSPTLTSMSVALTNFLFTLLAFSLIDRIGRRRILLSSIPIMIISLLICAMAFSSIKRPESPSSFNSHSTRGTTTSVTPLIILMSLTLYTAAYASGLGNVPWQQSELFPLRVRSFGSALATATNWGSNFIIGLTFLPMMEYLSPGGTFVIYAVVCVVGWVLIWIIYPEMSGLGLEEVKGLLANGWGVKESLRRREYQRT